MPREAVINPHHEITARSHPRSHLPCRTTTVNIDQTEHSEPILKHMKGSGKRRERPPRIWRFVAPAGVPSSHLPSGSLPPGILPAEGWHRSWRGDAPDSRRCPRSHRRGVEPDNHHRPRLASARSHGVRRGRTARRSRPTERHRKVRSVSDNVLRESPPCSTTLSKSVIRRGPWAASVAR